MGEIRPFLVWLGLGMLLSIAIGCHRNPILLAEDSIIPPAGGLYPVSVRPVFSPRLCGRSQLSEALQLSPAIIQGESKTGLRYEMLELDAADFKSLSPTPAIEQMPELNPTNNSILLKIPPLPEALPKTHIISS